MEGKYLFSVVMAVYNMELFLEEAVQSIIDQDFGFDRTQVILVNDGSQDRSREIIDAFVEKYPDNIFAVHKENGGVSSARNEGLKLVQGEYVNFLDSDDKLSKNTFRDIYDFFKRNGEGTDVVSIPLEFFEGATGPHVLNFKYRAGTRVIDLESEPNMPQLSLSSCFVKREVIERLGLQFDTQLAYAEDAKFLQPILCEKRTLGVASKCKYFYRRRVTGAPSAIQQGVMKYGWWITYLKQFTLETIRKCIEEQGEVPMFVKYTICYDIGWRFKIEELPESILTPEDIEEYWQLMHEILSYIDDEIILAQKFVYTEHKLLMLAVKHGCLPQARYVASSKTAHLCFPGHKSVVQLRNMTTRFERVEFDSENVVIEGSTVWPVFGTDMEGVIVKVSGQQYGMAEWVGEPVYSRSLSQNILCKRYFRIRMPNKALGADRYLRFSALYPFGEVELTNVKYGPLMPITQGVANSYMCKDGWALLSVKNGIELRPCNKVYEKRREKAFIKTLYKTNRGGMRKAAVARTLANIIKKFMRSRIWLISDKLDRAGDNGQVFFEYLMKEKPKGIRPYFVISAASPDSEKMKKIGKVVDYNTFRHKLMHLLADCVISASADGPEQNPFGPDVGNYYLDFLHKQKFVFLQHGVICDDLSSWLNRYNKRLDGFVTSARAEYDSIVDGNYHLDGDVVWLTGMPRYDKLYDSAEKKITIMPTWRRYLVTGIDVLTGKRKLDISFFDSDYFKFYSALLSDERLISAAQKYGYELQFYPHPTIIDNAGVFKAHESVKILTPATEYRTVYAESALVVTDYSSAVFDFAYLRKPVVYAQFDAEDFFGGSHTCKMGYFDFEQHGFGEVEHDIDSTVERIIEYMKNGCKMKPMYKARADKFFAYNDKNSCKRVFEKIKAIKD